MVEQNTIALLSKLVAFDTTSSRPNRALIDFIRDYLDGFGVASTLVAREDGKASLWAIISPTIATTSTDSQVTSGCDQSVVRRTEDRPNHQVSARQTTDEGAERVISNAASVITSPKYNGGIILAGHTDVVPVADQAWDSDPFTLTERDGKLYGRGTCDMKGFIACALALVPELVRAKLKQPVHLAFTHDEESDMSGAARLIDHLKAQNIRPSWAWVGEPTGLRVINAHKGVAAYESRFTGIAGHSGKPDLGLNAIDMAQDFMGILRDVAAERKANPITPSRFDPPYTTLNLGTIRGGTAENIIAGQCDLLWQIRAHPGDSAASFEQQVATKADSLFAKHRAKFPKAAIRTCACFDIPPLSPTVGNVGEETLLSCTGQTETEAVSFATEAGFFQKLGAHAVVCGPGSIDQAHQPDEFIEISQLTACLDLMRRVVMG